MNNKPKTTYMLAVEECARRVLNKGPELQVFKYDSSHKGGLICWCGEPHVLSQGPNKGGFTWRSVPLVTCIVSDDFIAYITTVLTQERAS